MTGSVPAPGSLAGVRFDPEGADFTGWLNDFKDQVYRNWMVPQSALGGGSGRVDFEFIVEQNGSLSALRLVRSSGQPALDRAAENALSASHFTGLPQDYRSPRATMQISFQYK